LEGTLKIRDIQNEDITELQSEVHNRGGAGATSARSVKLQKVNIYISAWLLSVLRLMVAKTKGMAQRKTKKVTNKYSSLSSTIWEATAEDAPPWQETSTEEQTEVRLTCRRRHQTRKEHRKVCAGVLCATW